ncbi:uncharacterized protein [Montipora capricornis]|uniref:uncharacterized protein n=1 Tax=Montipora capricornis TaxID=246305 RepID=UPI0035F14C47
MVSRKAMKRSAPENEYGRMRQRRRRTAFTDEQLDLLEETFQSEQFPGIQIREDLAREMKIREDRIQVWFQNRRSRWRKREIKNKPATRLLASGKSLPNSHVTSSTIFQPSPAIFPSPHTAPFRPWEPLYTPFSINHLLSPTVSSQWFRHVTSSPTPVTSQTTQTVNVMVHPRVTASASRSPSPTASLATLYQASCVHESDRERNRHSVDDYLAAVTLASGFQRENYPKATTSSASKPKESSVLCLKNIHEDPEVPKGMASRKSVKRSAPENEYDGTRQRRRRTTFTDEQLDRLEETFGKEKFPGIQIREDLARELNIGEDRIQVWFQNRRARWRKHEIKNKPAPGILLSENRQPICDVIPQTIFQTSPAIFPPLHSVPSRPWEPFYAPFSTTHWIPPRETLE